MNLPSYEAGNVASHGSTIRIDFFVKSYIIPMVRSSYKDIYKPDCIFFLFMQKGDIDDFCMQS